MNRTVSQYNAANQTQVNDRTRRFGYSGGVPNMLMDAKKSGLDCNPIEGGRLLLFLEGKDGFIQAGVDSLGNYRKAYHTNYPGNYLHAVDRRFHTQADHGFRPLGMLTKLAYETPPPPPAKAPNASEAKNNPYLVTQYNEKMADYEATYTDEWVREHDEAYTYFNIVHPELRDECAFGLNKPIQMTDAGVGASTLVMQACPTCRLKELRSEECEKRIFEASQYLDSEVLMNLRAVLIEACEAALLHAQNKIEEVEGEIKGRLAGEKAGRTRFGTIERILLKMLHKEEKKEQNIAEQLAQAMVTAAGAVQPAPIAPVAPAVPEGGVVISEEDAKFLAEARQKQAEAQERMRKAREAKLGNANNVSE